MWLMVALLIFIAGGSHSSKFSLIMSLRTVYANLRCRHDFDECKPDLAYYANLNNYPKHEACNDVIGDTQQRRSYDNDSAK